MKVAIRLYSKNKQTKKDELGIPHTSIAVRSIDTVEYTVEDSVPIGKQLAQINHFAQRVTGARYKAVLGAGKKMPAKIYFAYELSGKVYSSETSLVRANMQQIVAVSSKSLEGKEGKEIIDTVAAIQGTALRQAIGYLNDVAAISKECEGFDGTAVKSSTMLVTDGGLIDLIPAPVKLRAGRKDKVVTVTTDATTEVAPDPAS